MQPLEERLKDVSEQDREIFLKNIINAIKSDYTVEKILRKESAPRQALAKDIDQQLQEKNWKKIYDEYNLFILTKVRYGIDMMLPKNIPQNIFSNMALNEKIAFYAGIFIENMKTSTSILKEDSEKLSLQEVSDVVGYLIDQGIDYLKNTHRRKKYGYKSDPEKMPFKSIEENSKCLRERFNENINNHDKDQKLLSIILETKNFFKIMKIYNDSKDFGPRSKANSAAKRKLNDLEFEIPKRYYDKISESEKDSILKKYGTEAFEYINKKILQQKIQLNLF